MVTPTIISFKISFGSSVLGLSLVNIEKSDKPFDEWLNETYPAGSIERSAYIKANYIPETAGLTLSDFPAFIEERKKLMSAAFKALIS